MEFKKINNRYVLTPRERVLEILKAKKRLSLTQLSKLTFIQYDVLKKIIKKLEKENLINTITQIIETNSGSKHEYIEVFIDKKEKYEK